MSDDTPTRREDGLEALLALCGDDLRARERGLLYLVGYLDHALTVGRRSDSPSERAYGRSIWADALESALRLFGPG